MDIRDEIEGLSDDSPFALLPLRIETLFQQVGGTDQLWVRVFPDDCWITAFDHALTAAEKVNGWVYWVHRWAAAGTEAEVQAAWAALVQAHGAGRAAWIVHSYAPLELGAMPTMRAADAVLLVAAADQTMSAAVRAAAAAFWTQVWRDGATPAAEAEASGLLSALSDAEVAVVRTDLRPSNIAVEPPTGVERAAAGVSYDVLTFPAVTKRQRSFSQAPQVPLFPHQFRLIGMSHGKVVLDEPGEPIELPLYVGPDPTGKDDTLLITSDDRGELKVGERLSWLFDFDIAVKRGLGFRVKLEAGMAAEGFDRLFVLGIHVAGAEETAKAFDDLLRCHRYTSEDFEFVCVGSPTNNTDGHPTPYQRTDDPVVSYAPVHRAASLRVDASKRPVKTDGQRFVEVFGLPHDLIDTMIGAERFDAAEAEAMNTALWPATLGYFTEAMLATKDAVADAIVSDEAAENLRQYFGRYVSGRGPAPAVRVGRQPYGIVATTAFSRLAWAEQPPTGHLYPVVSLLAPVLQVLRHEWLAMSANAAHLPAPDDTTAEHLAAVLGLQASSATVYQRSGEHALTRFHLYSYSGDGAVMSNVRAMVERVSREMVHVLRDLGYRDEMPPELASKLFRRRAYRLRGPLVTRDPLSESERLADLPDFGLDYLRLLVGLAADGLEELRLEGKAEDPPDALLYLLAKFALERGYQHRANHLLERSGLSRREMAARKYEPPYVHVGEKVSNSRWRDLYSPLPTVTGDPQRPLHEFVTEEFRSGQPSELAELVEAVHRLSGVATARLDRLVAEHLDLCSYRLDVWFTSLVSYQLELMRFGGDPSATNHKRGMYIGAYGWLEDVRPRPREFRPVEIADAKVRATFERTLDTLVHDPTNGGFIAAPSLDHATTAAVLRAGYVSNAHRDEPDMLAVNLSSERVRLALVLLEGIRNGQGLGELLGYRLERALHDRDLPLVHTAIYALREAFPLRSGRLAVTAPPPGTPAEAIEARNVVDGQRLLEQVRRGSPTWPFGVALPGLDASLRTAVEEEIARLEDLYDAVADLALAEGVHQLLGGNPERAAATLDAFSQGGLPPDPDVASTPRRHLGLTHQVVLHLDADAGAGATPRSTAEPSLNAWLATVLPPAASVGCVVRVTDPVSGAVTSATITEADLGLEPIDVLMLVDPENDGLMGTLDDLLVERALAGATVRPDAAVEVAHTETIDGMVTFFELSAAVTELRPLLLGARPLRSDDAARALSPGADSVTAPRPAVAPSVSRVTRVDGPLAALQARRDAVEALRARLDADRAAAAAAIDSEFAAALDVLRPLDGFAVAAAGRGQLIAARRELVAAAVAVAASLRLRMNDRAAQCNALINAIGALPAGTPDADVIARWIEAERLVSTEATQERTDVVAVRTSVLARRAMFASRRDDLFDVIGPQVTTIAELVAAVDAARTAAPSYPTLFGEDLDTAPLMVAIDTLVDDIVRQCVAVVDEADRRIAAVEGLLTTPGSEAEAARALFGDGTPIIGSFAPPAGAASEIAAAMADEMALLAHARGPLALDDPVRDWRFGVARVRPAIWRWESVETVLAALHHRLPASLPTTLDTAALQLPHQPGAPWLAVEYPAGTVIDRDSLCYTVVNPAALAAGGEWCGLVLDEWPELIPLPDRTAGLAVHHDRPGSEPPQAWLVVTPPRWDGQWHWDDLVMALSDTLDLARIRAVEPDQIDQSRFGSLLPAMVFPVYPLQISMTLNLALNTPEFRKYREL